MICPFPECEFFLLGVSIRPTSVLVFYIYLSPLLWIQLPSHTTILVKQRHCWHYWNETPSTGIIFPRWLQNKVIGTDLFLPQSSKKASSLFSVLLIQIPCISPTVYPRPIPCDFKCVQQKIIWQSLSLKCQFCGVRILTDLEKFFVTSLFCFGIRSYLKFVLSS